MFGDLDVVRPAVVGEHDAALRQLRERHVLDPGGNRVVPAELWRRVEELANAARVVPAEGHLRVRGGGESFLIGDREDAILGEAGHDRLGRSRERRPHNDVRHRLRILRTLVGVLTGTLLNAATVLIGGVVGTLVGDRLPYLTALFTLNPVAAESLKGMDEFKGRPAELAKAPAVLAEIQKVDFFECTDNFSLFLFW